MVGTKVNPPRDCQSIIFTFQATIQTPPIRIAKGQNWRGESGRIFSDPTEEEAGSLNKKQDRKSRNLATKWPNDLRHPILS